MYEEGKISDRENELKSGVVTEHVTTYRLPELTPLLAIDYDIKECISGINELSVMITDVTARLIGFDPDDDSMEVEEPELQGEGELGRLRWTVGELKTTVNNLGRLATRLANGL